MIDSLTVLIPTGAPETGSIPTAPRPKSLKGLRVALLDNGKEFSDVVLDGAGRNAQAGLRRHQYQVLAQRLPGQGRAVHR